MGGMTVVKTSVYLDAERKADLARVAELTGRSQADLIRDGIDQVIHENLRARPRMRARLEKPGLTRKIDDMMDGFGE